MLFLPLCHPTESLLSSACWASSALLLCLGAAHYRTGGDGLAAGQPLLWDARTHVGLGWHRAPEWSDPGTRRLNGDKGPCWHPQGDSRFLPGCQAARLQALPREEGAGLRTIINPECELLHPLGLGEGRRKCAWREVGTLSDSLALACLDAIQSEPFPGKDGSWEGWRVGVGVGRALPQIRRLLPRGLWT